MADKSLTLAVPRHKDGQPIYLGFIKSLGIVMAALQVVGCFDLVSGLHLA